MATLSSKTGIVPGLVASYQVASFTAQPGFNYLVNTTAASRTVTLPTGSTGAQLQITDDAATWATNNCVVAPATGQRIQGLNNNDTLTLNISGSFILLSWDSTNSYWVVSGSGFQNVANATATTPGQVSTGTQTFGGAKTFTGAVVVQGALTPSAGIVGNSTGAVPSTGSIGYFQRTNVVRTSAVSMTSGTAINVTGGINLIAGIYAVSGAICATGSATSFRTDFSISTNNGVMASALGISGLSSFLNGSIVNIGTQDYYAAFPTVYVAVSTNTPVYLVTTPTFSGGTANVYGFLQIIQIA